MSNKINVMNDPQNRLSPLPKYLEAYRDQIVNFGFFYQKFGKYQFGRDNKLKTQHSWDNGLRNREKKDYEWSLVMNQFQKYKNHYKSIAPVLEKKHRLQRDCLMSYKVFDHEAIELSAATISRLLTGIGETTPTEVGMVFDRNTGLPFIPASTVKGAVRQAYCANFALKNEAAIGKDGMIDEMDIDGLVDVFGSLNTNDSYRGGFSFIDVYPATPPEIAIDIMNPHFGKYYRGEDAPVETDEPVPIKFLAVEKGAEFKVRGFFLVKKAQVHREKLIEAIKTAFCEMGIGAKTAVGYGRFHIDDVVLQTDKTNSPVHEPVQKDTPKNEIWENIHITYSPGNKEVKAFAETDAKKKATCIGLGNIPDTIIQELKNKKKAMALKVEVSAIGNRYKIVKIN